MEFSISIEDYLEFDPQDYKTTPYGKVRVCIAKQFGALPTESAAVMKFGGMARENVKRCGSHY